MEKLTPGEVEEALEAIQDMQISDWGARPGSILYDRADYFCKQGRILVAEVKRLREIEERIAIAREKSNGVNIYTAETVVGMLNWLESKI
jgi:hypothetical protein